MKPINLTNARPGKDHYNAELLYNSKNFRNVLFALKRGQEVGGHAVPQEVMLYVVKGRGFLKTGKEEHAVQQGDFVICKSNETHGIRAQEDVTVLAVIAPSP